MPARKFTPRIKSVYLLLIALLMCGGCSSLPPIATDTDYEYAAGTSGISIFRVEFQDMPEFLKPMLRDSASIVLASKGLEYTEGDAHAVLLMTFVPKPLATEDENRDDFSGTLSPGGDTRFIAEVHIELSNSVTGERIWSGVLSRYHSVSMGAYMHDAPARTAMTQAFVDLFANYPVAAD